jgi:hypothetical protein
VRVCVCVCVLLSMCPFVFVFLCLFVFVFGAENLVCLFPLFFFKYFAFDSQRVCKSDPTG